MAIIGPSDLPVVLKLNSDPLKSYALRKLGFPQVEVEFSEDQMETVLRTTGDFMAGYFPREQKLSVFYTQPLQPTYPMPTDAYWVQEVSWDPVISRIDDVFGAEAFLFCFPGGTQLLTDDGPKTCEQVHDDKSLKLVTPFGLRRPKMRWNSTKQPVSVIETDSDYLICSPNHPVNLEGKFRMAVLGQSGLHLLNSDDKAVEIQDYKQLRADGTWSIQTTSGCFYAGSVGKQFYLVH